MKTFKIRDSDLVIENGNLLMIGGKDEIVQSTERVLTTNKNEFFLDIDFGLDYSQIQGKGIDEESIRFAILEALNQDERVEEIEFLNIDIDRKTRNLEIDFRYTTNEGTIEGSEVVVVG